MGIIDSTWFQFTCPNCGTMETVVAHDKGSSFGGSAWQTLSAPSSFVIVATGGGRAEPEVTSASCTRCGMRANVDTGYGSSPN